MYVGCHLYDLMFFYGLAELGNQPPRAGVYIELCDLAELVKTNRHATSLT